MSLFGPPNVKKLKAKGDVKGLIKALGYKKDGKVRQSAAEALGEIGDPRAVEPLIAALAYERGGYVYEQAVKALGQIGDPRAVVPLMAALKGERGFADGAATEALGQIGAPATESLIAALKDEDVRVRQKAINLLSKIGATAVEMLIAALKDDDRNVRSDTAEALGQIGARLEDATLRTRAVESLIAALKDDDRRVRQAAAEALGKIGDERAVEPLVAVLASDRVASVCKTAIEVLGEFGDERAVEPLVAVLASDRVSVRKAAGQALTKLGWQPGKDATGVSYLVAQGHWDKCVAIGTAAVEPLIAALKDSSRRVRRAAVEALGTIGNERAVEPLIAVLESDRVEDVRRAAAEALGQIGGARAVESLIVELYKQDQATIRHPTSYEANVRKLLGQDQVMRRSAAKALVAIYRSGRLGAEDKKAILARKKDIKRLGRKWHNDSIHCSYHTDASLEGFHVDFSL